MKRVVVVSDVQYPYHNARAVRNVWSFIHEIQPDKVLIIGDFMDYPQPGRWSKDTRAEFEGSVFKDSEGGIKLLTELRDLYPGEIEYEDGNHDGRPRVYLEKYAPALAGEGTFNIERLLKFEDLGITKVPPFHPVAPGWVAMHGHELKGASPIPGRTAAGFARKLDVSVVMGHTHKLAVSPQTVGIGRKQRTLHGFEVGHLMDPMKAQYLSKGVSNWQLGFGVLEVGQYNSIPVPVYMEKDGSFVYAGVRYGALKRANNGRFSRAA